MKTERIHKLLHELEMERADNRLLAKLEFDPLKASEYRGRAAGIAEIIDLIREYLRKNETAHPPQ